MRSHASTCSSSRRVHPVHAGPTLTKFTPVRTTSTGAGRPAGDLPESGGGLESAIRNVGSPPTTKPPFASRRIGVRRPGAAGTLTPASSPSAPATPADRQAQADTGARRIGPAKYRVLGGCIVGQTLSLSPRRLTIPAKTIAQTISVRTTRRINRAY